MYKSTLVYLNHNVAQLIDAFEHIINIVTCAYSQQDMDASIAVMTHSFLITNYITYLYIYYNTKVLFK